MRRAWYVLGPFEMLVSCVALFACDALAQRLGVSQARRVFMCVAEAVALWNVSVMWGHPEDALAVGLAVYALVFALDGRWTGAGWLFGAAVATQPLVLLMLPVLVGMAGRENAVKVIARSIVPAVAVVLTPLVANFHATAHALLEQPNFPNIDHVTPWTSLAPVVAGSGKGLEVAAGPGRVVALVLACGLGFVATRWRERPDVLVWAACAALTLRCLTESVMDPFYIWPPIAIALVVAARSSAWRFAAVAVVACASTAVSNWHLGEWLWWGIVTGIVVFIVTVSVPQKAKDGERPLELKLDAQCADEVQRTFVPAFAIVIHSAQGNAKRRKGNGGMPQVVGLDIGTSAVRAAELEIGTGAPALIAFGQVGLPPGTIVDGEVQDVSAISDAIERLWQNGKFTSKSVVVGIAGLRAITRELDLPCVPDNEVDRAVRFQSEEVIPFPPDKTILSAQVLADNKTADGSAARRVLVAAAHHELVDGVVQQWSAPGCTSRASTSFLLLWFGPSWTARRSPSTPRQSCRLAPGSPSWWCTRAACRSSSGPSAPVATLPLPPLRLPSTFLSSMPRRSSAGSASTSHRSNRPNVRCNPRSSRSSPRFVTPSSTLRRCPDASPLPGCW